MALKNRDFSFNKRKKNRKIAGWKEIIKKAAFWLTFLSFCCVTVWTLIFSGLMDITKISIEGSLAKNNEIEGVVKEEISGHYLKHIPKSNLLLLPEKNIEAKLKNNFKLIKEIRIDRVFPNEMIVKLQQRQSKVAWCYNEDCYLIDENGDAFYYLQKSSPEIFESTSIIVEDSSSNNAELGHGIISSQVADFCSKISKVVEERISVETSDYLYTPSSMSEEIRVKTIAGWEIMFNTKEPIEKQIEILNKIIDQNIGRERLNEIEYLDLRLRGRATYKLKEPQKEEEKEGENEKNEKEKDQDEKKEED